MVTGLAPLPGKVAIVLDPPDEMTPGGIIIPDNARDHCSIGTVVACSQDAWYENGAAQLPIVKTGDRVAIGKWAGTAILYRGEEVVILLHSAILAVLDPAPIPVGDGCQP